MNKDELAMILQQGEGYFIEFKESFDKSLTREIVAFSNANGGRIFLGIGDDGILRGIEITNRLKSQIVDGAKGCDPSIFIDLEEFENVLILNVKEGDNKPYSCKDGFILRIGPNSQKMKRDEVIALGIRTGRIAFDAQICVFDWNDFDHEKFDYYLKLAAISSILDEKEILKNLQVLSAKGMTYAGVLMFAKSAYKYLKSSIIRCVHFNDSLRVDILDKKEVDKGIIGNIEYAVAYLKERVPVRFEIKGIKRKEYPEYAEEVYREAIVNAVVHRDYYDQRADIAVEKLTDRIVINNPGGLSFPKERFGNFSAPRNRLIADLLGKTHLMEKAGTGIQRMKNYSSANGNEISFEFNEFFFVDILSNYKKNERVNERVNEGVNEGALLEYIKQNPGKRLVHASGKLKIPVKTLERWVKQLRQKGMIEYKGSPKTGGYYDIDEVVNEGGKGGVNEGVNVLLGFIRDNPGRRLTYASHMLKTPSKTLERWAKELKEKGSIEFRGSPKTGGYYLKH